MAQVESYEPITEEFIQAHRAEAAWRIEPETLVGTQYIESLLYRTAISGVASLKDDFGNTDVVGIEVLRGLQFEAIVFKLAAKNIREGMLVGKPHDGIDSTQGTNALRGAEEFLVIGEAELELGNGETAFCQRIGWDIVERLVIVLVARAEVEISLEVLSKTR